MATSKVTALTLADYERLLVLAEADGDEQLIGKVTKRCRELQTRQRHNEHAAKLEGLVS